MSKEEKGINAILEELAKTQVNLVKAQAQARTEERVGRIEVNLYGEGNKDGKKIIISW